MKDFCKVFTDEDIGQILVKLDSSDETFKPEVRFYCQPADLGVCSMALIFTDDDAGWDKAEKAFTEMNKETAVNAVSRRFDL